METSGLPGTYVHPETEGGKQSANLIINVYHGQDYWLALVIDDIYYIDTVHTQYAGIDYIS